MLNKVRIIVGPNGSGKSTIKGVLSDEYNIDFGYFINADEIEKAFRSQRQFSNVFSIKQKEANFFFNTHALNKIHSLKKLISNIKFFTKTIKVSLPINSYEAAAVADLLRYKSLENGIKFSYETVFSDKSKIGFIKKLVKNKYKIYLYVIATLNPEINKSRVKLRISKKGHSVPENKIEKRYYKSLSNIKKVIPLSYKCFIIDNSQELSPVLVAEIYKGKTINFLNKNYQPQWAKKLIK